MKKKRKITVITTLVFLIIVGFIYYGITKIDFIGSKSPEYYEYVQNRINFGTFQCKRTIQWDTTISRIDDFFLKNKRYELPDSFGIEMVEYLGPNMSQKEKAIFFNQAPKEVFIVTFDLGSFNHLDKIYSIKNDTLIYKITDTLSDSEKARILERLKSEILSKIEWDVSAIKFPTKEEL